MEIFEERYFIFNKKLFDFMGLWPFGSNTRNIRKCLWLVILFIFILPQITSAVVNYTDVDRVMLNLICSFVSILMFLKVLSLVLTETEMKRLYRNIADNWMTITDEKEKEILIEYSEVARTKAIYYFIFTHIGAHGLYILPSIPQILDMHIPSENSRPKIYILEDELFIDREHYYIVYYIWDAIGVIINSFVSVTIDVMYIVCVEHCCALFAIISHRLRNLNSEMLDNCTEAPCDYVSGIIQLHQKTLKFTATIDKAFAKLFLFIMFANTVTIPLTAVTVLANLDKLFNCARFVMLLVVLGVHLFMLFWPGQNVLDHSTKLTDDAYSNEWYTLPIRSRRIIVILMIRCTRPSLMTAGGLMLMNFETYSKIIRTAISYITVVASFR